MKKSYSKAEAFKVTFNSKEQVAAACVYTAADYESKFPGDGADICTVVADMYATGADIGMCLLDANGVGVSAFSTGIDFSQYLQYAE